MQKNIIQETILSHLNELNSIFIFPTQTAADLWADRTTLVSDFTAVAMERFVAWDKFKSSSIKSIHQDKKSVPSEMRRIFATNLIEENKQTPFLTSLIVPEYASSADGFANWISNLLPSLASWKNYFDQKKLEPDDDDKDLLAIYEKYDSFLKKYELFDPAWEYPPFKADGNHYYIFFPEILSDWFEYEKILNSSPDITLINFKDLKEEYIPQNLEGMLFLNGRLEVKNMALLLKQLHEEKNIPWNEIAVNVPDLESYGPFIERELELYQIPYVTKTAAVLSSTCAGSLFSQISACVKQNFSFETLRNLILNTELPWIEPDLNSQLIEFGKSNNCVCSFMSGEKLVDPWKESFKNGTKEVTRLSNYYNALKNILTALYNSKSFEEIHTLYFKFREQFFSTDYEPRTDKIISRCLVKLSELVDLEAEFSECELSSPFKFFVQSLDSEKYLEQSEKNGVQILPYRMAATSPFKCHVIMDASQSSLSVVFKQMNFLREDKRKMLFSKNYEDPNVTEHFIRLYAMNSTEIPAIFTVAEKTFTGYSQVSSYLTEKNLKSVYTIKELEKYDSWKQEKNWYADENLPFPEKISELQKNAFTSWFNANQCSQKESENFRKNYENQLSEKYREKISCKENNEKIFVSYTQLNKFFECPRIWFMNKILKLSIQDNEAELMGKFDMGDIYHKIFENYSRTLMKNNWPVGINPETGSLSPQYKEVLLKAVEKALSESKNSFLSKELIYSSRISIESVVENAIIEFSDKFNGFLYKGVELEVKSDFSEKIFLDGKIDCLLYNPSDDEYVIVDYKTSSVPGNLYVDPVNPKWPEDFAEKQKMEQEIMERRNAPTVQNKDFPHFQIPAYYHLLKEKLGIDAKNACFFSIKNATFSLAFGEYITKLLGKRTLVTREQFEPTYQYFLKSMNEYAELIENCQLPVFNQKQDFSTCHGCDYRAVCRRTFTVSKAKN